jgi:hypothetical protein
MAAECRIWVDQSMITSKLPLCDSDKEYNFGYGPKDKWKLLVKDEKSGLSS